MPNKKFSDLNFKDLIFVLLYTIILSVAFGIILGYADFYLISSVNFSLGGFLYWIIAIYIGTTIRKSITEPHIVYTIIAGIGMVFSFAILNTVPIFLLNGISLQDYEIFLDITYYFHILILTLNPFNGIGMGFLSYIITILIFGVGTYLGIQKTLH
ncbi:MAG: hypothetical protein KKE16_07605 [Firmicutes bacterium]|nr:hypothetical protein [Bacillota bacterium]